MTRPDPISRRVLNRTLLARQGLLEPLAVDPVDVVRRLVGMQAQEPADPYVGLWSRIADFDPMTLSDAIEARRLVRMGSLRTTLHLMTADDALAIAPLTADVHRRTFENTPFAKELVGLDRSAVLEAAREALEERPMTPGDLGKYLAVRWPDRDPASLAYLARYALPLVQVPPRGLWRRTSRATNTTLEAWIGRATAATTVDELVLRYLRAFGPASTADIRTWSWFTAIREVVDRLRPGLRTYRDESGRELLDVPDGEFASADVPAPVRFLPQYDNVFLSHDDRSRISGELAWGADFGWKGPVLIDGGIAGAWRVRRSGKTASMTVELARPVSADERRDLEAVAERLALFLDPDRTRELSIVAWGSTA